MLNDPEPPAAARCIKTYGLAEVAAMVLPPEWTDARRWLVRRLNRGEIRGYKIGRTWRMTHADVEDFIAKRHNDPVPTAVEPTSVADGLSPRSRRRLMRRN